MDQLGGMGSFPGDPKTQVMGQVQQEAAMQNARMLVEVYTLCIPYYHTSLANIIPETQRTLLRALRAQARNLALQGRRKLLHVMHGEVHERMEHSQQAVRRQDTKGAAERCGAKLVGVGLDQEEV